jgi:hypothetical protein
MVDTKPVNKYSKQREWADYFMPEQQAIIEEFKGRLDFRKAEKKHAYRYDQKEDMERNTDLLIFEYNSLRIALRVRDANIKYRDVTIRSYNKGYKTEVDKIKEGFGDYMLYCWGSLDKDKVPTISDYLLFDLDCFRKLNDYFYMDNKDNKDGTKFNIYSTPKIICSQCSIVSHMPSLLKK